MKRKTTATHINVPKKVLVLVENLPALYGTTLAERVKYVYHFSSPVIKSLLPNIPESKLTDLIKITAPEYIERHTMVQVSFRSNLFLKESLCKITGAKDLSQAVTTALCMLYKYHCSTIPEQNESFANSILSVMGNKNWLHKEFQNMLIQLPASITEVVDIFGGSGILSILACASNKFDICTYNDDDKDKQNFFDVIAKAPAEFKMAILCEDLDSLSRNCLTDGESKIIDAATFYIKGFKKKNWNISKLDDLFTISAIFKNIKVSAIDCLKVSKSILNKENTLSLYDPPYARTRGYKQRNTDSEVKDFSDEKHEELELHLAKSKGIFIYFCRVTAPRDRRFGHQKYIKEDDWYRGTMEDTFANKGLYCCDFPYGYLGTIERIITNFPFEGFSEFMFPNKDNKIHFFKDK